MPHSTARSCFRKKKKKPRACARGSFSNHAFVDGNKRIGIYVLLTFLEVNGISLEVTDEELIEVGLSLAKGEMKYEDLLAWLFSHEI